MNEFVSQFGITIGRGMKGEPMDRALTEIRRDEPGFIRHRSTVKELLRSGQIGREGNILSIMELTQCPDFMDAEEAYEFVNEHGAEIGRLYRERENIIPLESTLSDILCSWGGCDADIAWLLYIRNYSDVYRFHSVDMDDNTKRERIRDGINFAAKAFDRLSYISKEPGRVEFRFRDTSACIIGLSLCDSEVGNLDRARDFMGKIMEDDIKKIINREIDLEERRRAMGLGEEWKKMERTRQIQQPWDYHAKKLLRDLSRKEVSLSDIELRGREIGPMTTVGINLNITDIEAVLTDGEYKSAFQVFNYPRHTYMLEDGSDTEGRTIRYLNGVRKAFKGLGLMSKCTNGDKSPVFGYMLVEPEDIINGGASMYGDVILVLDRERVMPRTSFTDNDSLTVGGGYPVTADVAILLKAIYDITKVRVGGGFLNEYVEAQIHGGVTTEDIKRVVCVLSEKPVKRKQQIRKIKRLKREFPDIEISVYDPRRKAST